MERGVLRMIILCLVQAGCILQYRLYAELDCNTDVLSLHINPYSSIIFDGLLCKFTKIQNSL